MSQPQAMEPFRQRAQVALADPALQRAVNVATERFRLGRLRMAARFDSLGTAGDFDRLREHARAIRAHTVAHLDRYLQQLAQQVRARGGHVYFATSGEDAVEYVRRLVQERGIRLAVKSKSMISEEIRLNDALAQEGVEAVETDLGEYIIQLAGETPAHIIAPAFHKTRRQVAELFDLKPEGSQDPNAGELTAYARRQLREKFLAADLGITGCNFAVAGTGTVCLVTNEGNGRMVTTLPPTLVTLMGMERVVPTLEDLDVMLDLLARSATGQQITSYTTLFTGPRRPGETDGPEEFHLVIVDNGRSRLLGSEYQEALHCIRCGACLNVCPVYRQVGGHAYGWVYSGPIGAVLTPLYQGFERFGDLPMASSLCGACWEACPVKIPLHDLLVKLRRDGARGGPDLLEEARSWGLGPEGDSCARPAGEESGKARGVAPAAAAGGRAIASKASWERLAFSAWRAVMVRPQLYRWALRAVRLLQAPVVRRGYFRWAPPPLAQWLKTRDFPAVAPRSFAERWERFGDHWRLPARRDGATVPPVPAPGAAANGVAPAGNPVPGVAAGAAGSHPSPSLPASPLLPVSPVPAHPGRRPVRKGLAELDGLRRAERFAQELEAVGGIVLRVEGPEDLQRALEHIVRKEQVGTVLCSADPRLEQAGAVAALQALMEPSPGGPPSGEPSGRVRPPLGLLREPLPHREAAQADLGLTWAEYGIAETGTMVLFARPGTGRVPSLLPRLHVAVLPVSRLVATRSEVFGALSAEPERLPSGVLLITGPSRTADIEMEITLGVHGPGRVYAILLAYSQLPM